MDLGIIPEGKIVSSDESKALKMLKLVLTKRNLITAVCLKKEEKNISIHPDKTPLMLHQSYLLLPAWPCPSFCNYAPDLKETKCHKLIRLSTMIIN